MIVNSGKLLPFCSELYYNYECMQGWFDEDMEDYEERFSDSTYKELQQAAFYGDVMQRKLYNLCHLNNFQQRITGYRPGNALEYSVLNVARKAHALIETYPQGRVFENMRNQEFDQGEEIIRGEQYISFIAQTQGTLYDQIAQMVNDEFNECGEMEIPTLTQIFDAKNSPQRQGLDFEYRLFPLINELCEILNNLP